MKLANSIVGKNCCDKTTMPLPHDESAKELACLAWAIAHPARVRIVRLLASRKNCVCGEIVAELPLAQSTVSQHLKILKDAGIVDGEIDGPNVCYGLNRKKLESLKTLVGGL